MTFAKRSTRAGLSVVLLFALTTTYGQDGRHFNSGQESASAETSLVLLQDEKKPKKKPKKPRGRLPNNYGKVGVTKDQRDKIYAVQADYNTKIAALEKQIADLKSKRDAEIEAVLTLDQKKKLTELQEAAKKKREAGKKKKKSKTD